MSARYNRVSPRYWILSRGWEDRLRLLGLYVQTCEHRTGEGLYRLPLAYIAADLGWTPAVAERQMEQLATTGFVKYDAMAEVVLLPDALEVQAPSTENQIKGAMARIRMVPATPLLWDLLSHADTHANGLAEAMRMEFGVASERVVSESANGHSNSRTLAHAHSPTTRDERG